eukprot:gene2765-12638_t
MPRGSIIIIITKKCPRASASRAPSSTELYTFNSHIGKARVKEVEQRSGMHADALKVAYARALEARKQKYGDNHDSDDDPDFESWLSENGWDEPEGVPNNSKNYSSAPLSAIEQLGDVGEGGSRDPSMPKVPKYEGEGAVLLKQLMLASDNCPEAFPMRRRRSSCSTYAKAGALAEVMGEMIGSPKSPKGGLSGRSSRAVKAVRGSMQMPAGYQTHYKSASDIAPAATFTLARGCCPSEDAELPYCHPPSPSASSANQGGDASTPYSLQANSKTVCPLATLQKPALMAQAFCLCIGCPGKLH